MASKRWIGMTVAGEKIILVDLAVPLNGALVVQNDMSLDLPKGDRPAAYAVIYQRILDYVHEHGIKNVALKASAVPQGGRVSGAHLNSAELRGVAAAAAHQGGATVHLIKKAGMSKTFGSRKVDEYLADNSFWKSSLDGELRIGSREAAMMVVGITRDRNE